MNSKAINREFRFFIITWLTSTEVVFSYSPLFSYYSNILSTHTKTCIGRLSSATVKDNQINCQFTSRPAKHMVNLSRGAASKPLSLNFTWANVRLKCAILQGSLRSMINFGRNRSNQSNLTHKFNQSVQSMSTVQRRSESENRSTAEFQSSSILSILCMKITFSLFNDLFNYSNLAIWLKTKKFNKRFHLLTRTTGITWIWWY